MSVLPKSMRGRRKNLLVWFDYICHENIHLVMDTEVFLPACIMFHIKHHWASGCKCDFDFDTKRVYLGRKETIKVTFRLFHGKNWRRSSVWSLFTPVCFFVKFVFVHRVLGCSPWPIVKEWLIVVMSHTNKNNKLTQMTSRHVLFTSLNPAETIKLLYQMSH